jgi:hypothetical protein
MSLKAFHLLFIAMSVVLAAFCAAWAVGQYRVEPRPERIAGEVQQDHGHHAGFMVAAAGSVLVAGGLAAYGASFHRRTKNL